MTAELREPILLAAESDVAIAGFGVATGWAHETPRLRGVTDRAMQWLAATPGVTARWQVDALVTYFMKRRACPYLTYWTHGDTRNRGVAILRFKQAYGAAGFTLGSEELPDHLAVVLEFAAVGDPAIGDALLAEHAGPIGLLREALHDLGSGYARVLDAVTATLPEVTPEVASRMAEMAASGPPVELVGLEPFPTALTTTGARR